MTLKEATLLWQHNLKPFSAHLHVSGEYKTGLISEECMLCNKLSWTNTFSLSSFVLGCWATRRRLKLEEASRNRWFTAPDSSLYTDAKTGLLIFSCDTNLFIYLCFISFIYFSFIGYTCYWFRWITIDVRSCNNISSQQGGPGVGSLVARLQTFNIPSHSWRCELWLPSNQFSKETHLTRQSFLHAETAEEWFLVFLRSISSSPTAERLYCTLKKLKSVFHV